MNKLTLRRIQTFNAILTLAVLFASFYFQYVVGLVPCPLCIMQRLCVFLLLAIMGLSFTTLKKAHFVSLMQIIVSCLGLFFSLRQLWLQSLPSGKVPACMPGLDILIRYFPLKTVLSTLFWGTGDCAEVSWRLWGISMTGWCTMYFMLMAIVGCFLFYHTRSSTLGSSALS